MEEERARELAESLRRGRLSRRSFLELVGGAAAGTAVGGSALSILDACTPSSSSTTQSNTTSKLAIVYESEPTLLDPDAFGSKGDDAVRMSCVNQLLRRKTKGGPYD